jgi:hypothetical protein
MFFKRVNGNPNLYERPRHEKDNTMWAKVIYVSVLLTCLDNPYVHFDYAFNGIAGQPNANT